MNRLFKGCCILVGTVILLVACQQKKVHSPLPPDVEILYQNEDQLTKVIIYDVFTPPVASRIYMYSSLASYEAVRYSVAGAPSIAEKLHGFAKLPQPEKSKTYNYTLAATKAFFTVVHNVKVFSVDSLKSYETSTYNSFRETMDDSTFLWSVAFGESIGKVILERAATDGYSASRGKPKFLGSREPGKWRPTPPDYLDGVEWCWNTMKPLVLDSASQVMPPRPPIFSTDTNSAFFKGVREVYTISKNLTAEQKIIARYWDDNPFVLEHSGHLMFANKKITPAGHWMGITTIAARQAKVNKVEAARAYALTSIALYDAFISCWDEKYRSNYIRPITVINEMIDHSWSSFLQTPPFPEYTSGHSTITRAAAVVLTELFGDHVAFLDTSDLAYIGLQRQFYSFVEAANEASVSRVYGGIHYRISVDEGAKAGQRIGELVIQKIFPKK